MAGLVVAHEPAAVAHGLERMLHEPGLHSRLAGGCRRVAAGLDWGGPAQEMETLYARLVGGRSGGGGAGVVWGRVVCGRPTPFFLRFLCTPNLPPPTSLV